MNPDDLRYLDDEVHHLVAELRDTRSMLRAVFVCGLGIGIAMGSAAAVLYTAKDITRLEIQLEQAMQPAGIAQ